MKFKNTDITMTPEILRRKTGGEMAVPVTVAQGSFSSGICKAGTPLTRLGAIANDGTGEGILWNDVTEDNPNGSLIIGFATINTAVAQAHSGVEYSELFKAAVSNIIFD